MKNSVVLLGMFLLFIACNSGPKTPEKQILQGGALGTTYGISYISKTPLLTRAAMDSLLQVVNQSMSTYWPDSDISRINRGDSAVIVEPMFREVFELSGLVYKASGGYFDPTVGPLVNAWGFGPEKALELTPDRVDSLMAYVGFSKVSLLPSGKIEKNDPAIYFDFNAIAKGYSVDVISRFLSINNITNYLVEVGGEIRSSGMNLDGNKNWRVGLDTPRFDGLQRDLYKIFNLKDKSMATSGVYRKFKIDSSGNKYAHIIDPKTGYSSTSNILSVTVISEDCIEADAYATVLQLMSVDEITLL